MRFFLAKIAYIISTRCKKQFLCCRILKKSIRFDSFRSLRDKNRRNPFASILEKFAILANFSPKLSHFRREFPFKTVSSRRRKLPEIFREIRSREIEHKNTMLSVRFVEEARLINFRFVISVDNEESRVVPLRNAQSVIRLTSANEGGARAWTWLNFDVASRI